ncbi:MAG: alanine--tRNA ligase [Flavobacteriales bacterium]
MEAAQIRKTFFDFFASKSHEIVPSAPMVIKDDPTLMFTNAGMNQFKDIFLGNSPVKFSRIANSQKCLRVSGKHNDLEEVGVDTYHHTMFEMLGNWSFGDYFKKEAIEWAWELLTEHYKLDKDRLYVTVFGGDDADGLSPDNDARSIWRNLIDEDRIIDCDKKDNFWEMGDTGPCGPCSEIHVDLRDGAERAASPGRDRVNKDDPRVIEIWNLVFMEFNRMADGSLRKLPAQHIDTGMGFERLAVALQNKKSNYDTDIFRPTIAEIERISGIAYTGGDGKSDVAMRVIADHLRAVSFSIADGQLPSNSGAGYVIRRILRRAIRYAFSFLNLKEPFICELSRLLVAQMGPFFPELQRQSDLIQRVIREEEEAFLRTLDRGILLLEEKMNAGGNALDGKVVFDLYDTFGFPADLTALIASERGMRIDDAGFQAELQQQKDRSRAAGKIEAGDWIELHEDAVSEFVGYDQTSAEVHITRYRKVVQKGQERYQLVFNITPFYAEGGGQVGDTGTLANGNESISIVDTKRENNLIVHYAEALPTQPDARFTAQVDAQRRLSIARNHSATHLLHEALREVLGTHVEQKGSLVGPDYLRFDFSHFGKMSDNEVAEVERRVNERVLANLALEEHRAMPMEEARETGAMMLFGEKYGDVVRVIRFGSSVELCGGTHVSATGAIGSFVLASEGAVASGVRRIEALTGDAARNYFASHIETLNEVRALLKNPGELAKAVADLVEKNAQLSRELESFRKQQANSVRAELAAQFSEVNGVQFLAAKVDLGPAEIKDIAFSFRSEKSNMFAVFGSEAEGKPTITCVISDDLVVSRQLNAGAVVRELAKAIQGGGGGQAFFATAGGKDPKGLDEAIKKAASFIS